MRPELSILSFLCVALLAGLVPLHIRARNVAMLALVAWLLLCNIVQGVNSVVWFNNARVRSRGWCDISTKLLLGARVGLPAACACIAIHLHSLACNRDTKQRRHRALLEIVLCILMPFLYMTLHIIVQNHRFDLLQEFGCVPSIYPSTPAIFLVWMPPLIICSITFVFATLAVWSHIRRNPLISDRAGLPSRVITITFLRPLLMASAICVLVFSVSIFDIQARTSASHGLLPWISWSHVHSDLAHVRVIDASQALDAARIEVSWWLIPTSSMVFILMALVGLVCCVQHDTENSRSVGKWFRSTILRRPGGGDTFIQSTPAVMSRITVTSPTPPLPLTLNAGWDDTLRSTRKSQRPTLKCDIPRTPSTASDTESDASFKASTLTYLTSPTGRQASVLSGLPPTDLPLAKVHPPTPPPIAVMSPSSLDTSAGLSVSPTRSILSSPWPAPPNTVPPTLPIALTAHAREQHLRSASEVSLTTSLASSTMSMSGYLPDPDIFLHSVANANHRVPFQDAGIPMPVTAAPPRHARRTPSKELLPRALIQSASAKRKVGKKREQEEAIYMTVVHETQAY